LGSKETGGIVVSDKSAIILFSGGIDSTVTLALAIEKGINCHCLSFDYGQRHKIELTAAKKICDHYGLKQRIITIDPNCFSGCSLVDQDIDVPTGRTESEIVKAGIPNTYVPARNTLFLSFAMGYCEILAADEIHLGFNIMDRSGYPDCRPEFVEAFQGVMNVATKQSAEYSAPQLITPLIDLNKTEIIALGRKLHVPLELTHSCYSPNADDLPCGQCDACRLREEAFMQA
jgi:7-cyano-7-deazaguanine synthase